MSPLKKVGLGVAAVALSGGLVAGAVSIANAAGDDSGFGQGMGQYGPPGMSAQRGGPWSMRDGSADAHGGQHTVVTGAARSRVVQAATAKVSGLTVQQVFRDSDGSYDVLGARSGSPVMVQVSKDLGTVQVRTGGPGGGHEMNGSGERFGPPPGMSGQPGEGMMAPQGGQSSQTTPPSGAQPPSI